MAASFDSGRQPLTEHHMMSPPYTNKSEYNYNNNGNMGSNSPYGDSYYAQSAGYIPPQTPRKPLSKWIKFGIPAAVVIIAAIVVGIAVGVSKHNSQQQTTEEAAASASSASASANSQSPPGLFVTSYGSQYLNPYYPSTVRFCFHISLIDFSAHSYIFLFLKQFLDRLCPIHHSNMQPRPRLLAKRHLLARKP